MPLAIDSQDRPRRLLHYDPIFTPEDGVTLPVANQGRPLKTPDLNRVYRLLRGSIERFGNACIVHFMLTLPQEDVLWDDLGSSDVLSRFLLLIKSRLLKDADQHCPTTHPAVFHIASRESTHPRRPPCFHVVLIMEGSRYALPAWRDSEGDSLLRKIIESWADVIQVPQQAAASYVSYQPGKPGLSVYPLSLEDGYARLPDAFEKISTLCRVKGHQEGQRYRGVIMSRA